MLVSKVKFEKVHAIASDYIPRYVCNTVLQLCHVTGGGSYQTGKWQNPFHRLASLSLVCHRLLLLPILLL